jgi:signal transduction histidine kinase
MDYELRGDEPVRRRAGVTQRADDEYPSESVPLGRKPTIADGLREHVDRSPLAIALVEGATHRIRYANPAFRELANGQERPLADRVSGVRSGTPLDEIVSCTVADVLPLVAGRLLELLGRVAERGEPQTDVEIAWEPADVTLEDSVWSVTVWPVPQSGGRSDHLMVQVRDVTDEALERRRRAGLLDELRAVNEQLVLASLREEDLKAQAEASSTAKSQFLATMSHELRTPLAAIIGYEELLIDGITGPVTDAQRMQLGRIKSSAAHLLALIDEVLTLARVEAQRELVHREAVGVTSVVEAVMALIAPLAAAKGLTLTVELSESGAPGTLYTDALKVRQILVNLLGNAVKYTERGEVTLTIRSSREALVFEVRDSGVGVPSEHIERIFDTFWQVHQTTTRTAGGAGLGLSVSRRLARLLGGDITVASSMGRGSTFTLWLPLDDVSEMGAVGQTVNA